MKSLYRPPWIACFATVLGIRFVPGILLACALASAGAMAAEVTKSAADYAVDLESSDKAVKREAAYQLSRMGRDARVALPQLIKALDDEQQQVWFGAITALAALGPEAEPALPALLKELDAWQPFRKDRQGAQALYRTAFALGAIGAPAVPALSNGLASDKWFVRAGSAKALGFSGTLAHPVIPRLTWALGDERAEVRDSATETLAGLGPAAVGALTETLKSGEEPRARVAAAGTLRRLGTNSAPAIPVLREAIRSDKDPSVRGESLMALARSGLEPVALVSTLIAAWKGDDPALRKAAHGALLMVRPVDRVVLPAVLPELQATDPAARDRAAALIAELGPDARGAAAPLASLLRKSGDAPADPSLTRALAALGDAGLEAAFAELGRLPPSRMPATNHWALATLRQAGIIGLPRMIGALTNASPVVRAGALEGIAGLGERARPAAKRLPPLLGDPEAFVRARAWIAAGAAGMPADVMLARLDDGLRDASPEVRRSAIDGVARLGRAAKSAVPKLVEELGSRDAALQLAVVRALAALGPDAESAAAPLGAMLGKGSDIPRVEVLAALGSIGPAAASELPAMSTLATGEDSSVRRAYLDAIARFKQAGHPALPQVEGALKDSDPRVRAAAVTARVAIEPEGTGAVEPATAALEDAVPEVRRAAAEALARLEERARPAEAKLFAMLASAEDRPAAVVALRAIHPTSVPSLIEAMGHSDWTVREVAADGLSRLGKGGADALPVLEKAVREDSQEEVKRASRRALRRIREG